MSITSNRLIEVLHRSCPGKKLGLNNVQLFVSYLLYSFDILPILDSSGQPKFPDPEFVSGLISYVLLQGESRV
jgi:hypothetical protein